MGTARMGKDDSSAVVDKDFKVFGVEKLRIADMSVIPIVSK
jgi:choline dehydrogenase-like flavoprotein